MDLNIRAKTTQPINEQYRMTRRGKIFSGQRCTPRKQLTAPFCSEKKNLHKVKKGRRLLIEIKHL